MNENLGEQLRPIEAQLKELHARQSVLEKEQREKKADEITETEKEELNKCNEDITAQENARRNVWNTYSQNNPIIPQLIDLALLQNGLLRGEALSKFITRSVDLIK